MRSLRRRTALHPTAIAPAAMNFVETKAKQAETNRIRHGRTQAEKDRERAERERAERAIEGKRLERDPEATTPAAPSEVRLRGGRK